MGYVLNLKKVAWHTALEYPIGLYDPFPLCCSDSLPPYKTKWQQNWGPLGHTHNAMQGMFKVGAREGRGGIQGPWDTCQQLKHTFSQFCHMNVAT